MSRFDFDVREGPSFTPDDEGSEFDSLDETECEAATSVVEIGRDRLPKGDAREVTVELRNEHRQPVLTVRWRCRSVGLTLRRSLRVGEKTAAR
jgi:hypothetical protein